MKNLLCAMLLAGWALDAAAVPYKIVIYATDADALEQANQFPAYLRSQPPFRDMPAADLVVEVVQRNTTCRAGEMARTINCDIDRLMEDAHRRGAHMATALTSQVLGASGGPIAMASTIGYRPNETLFHEMLHVYGLADEYTYDQAEQNAHCEEENAPNVAVFPPMDHYADDAAARARHARQIPWFGHIRAAPVGLITHGTALGTHGMILGAGLYPGGACSRPGRHVWRPYEDSLMNHTTPQTLQPYYVQQVVRAIEDQRREPLRLTTDHSHRAAPRDAFPGCAPTPSILAPEAEENFHAVRLRLSL